jgi:hypothetical protein
MTIFSYSTNEDNFFGDFETPEDAAYTCFEQHPDVDTVYIGNRRNFTAHDFVSPVILLEYIANAAFDECGSSALDWLEKFKIDKSKREEFKKLIGDWLEANDPVTFFGIDDVLEYQRPDEEDTDFV